MNKENQTYFDLLDLIHQQEQIIHKQGETIASLVNQTAEQESIINSLMGQYIGTEKDGDKFEFSSVD